MPFDQLIMIMRVNEAPPIFVLYFGKFILCKGMYASVQLSNRINHTCRDTVPNKVRVIIHVYVYGKIVRNDHDPHEQSI